MICPSLNQDTLGGGEPVKEVTKREGAPVGTFRSISWVKVGGHSTESGTEKIDHSC